MATGTQMVLEAKKNKLNNSSKWFTFVKKLDRSFKLRSFCVHLLMFKNIFLLKNRKN